MGLREDGNAEYEVKRSTSKNVGIMVRKWNSDCPGRWSQADCLLFCFCSVLMGDICMSTGITQKRGGNCQ